MKYKRWHGIAALALAFAVALSFMPFNALAFNGDEAKAEKEVKVENQNEKKSENPEKKMEGATLRTAVEVVDSEQKDKLKTDEKVMNLNHKDKLKTSTDLELASPTKLHKVQAQQSQDKTLTITFTYNMSYNSTYYNPADKGKDNPFTFKLTLKGKNKETGSVENGINAGWFTIHTKVGEDFDFKLPLPNGEYTDENGKVYTDVEPNYLQAGYYPNQHVYYYLSISGVSGTGIQGKSYDCDVIQQMNMMAKNSIEQGAIIPDKYIGENKIPVEYTISRTYKNEKPQYPLKYGSSEVISGNSYFDANKDTQLWDLGPNFYMAIYGNETSIFKNGVQIAKNKLVANFAGENKDELNKYFTLDVQGDALSPWNVILKSKLKKETQDTVEDLDFTTERVADNTMIKGKEVIKQQGKKGSITHHTEIIYLPGTDGAKEVVQTKEVGTNRVEPVKEIIHYGTKEAVPPTIKGAVDKTITRGDTFNPLDGITAVDQDGNQIILDDSVVTENTVKTDTVGEYKVTYTVTDKYGTKATKTIKVKVVAKTFKVTFDANGGKPVPGNQIIEEGKKATKPEDPKRYGYKFNGWFSGSHKWNFDKDTVGKNDLTLVAQWEKDEVTPPTPAPKEEYTLTFDANGGKFQDNTSVKTFKYKEGEKIKIIGAPSRGGYKFDYWKGSKYNPGDEYEVKDNHTFTAQWIKEEKPTPNPGTGDGGTTPAKPGTDNGNKKPENTGDKKPAKPANPKKSPNTGDSSALAGYGLILLAGTALVAMTTRKKNMR